MIIGWTVLHFYTGEQFRELKCNFNAFFSYKDICAEFIYMLLYTIYFYFTLLCLITVYSAVLQFIYAADVLILDLILRFPLVLKTTESVTREMMKRTFLK